MEMDAHPNVSLNMVINAITLMGQVYQIALVITDLMVLL
jgi:hypothetical protein